MNTAINTLCADDSAFTSRPASTLPIMTLVDDAGDAAGIDLAAIDDNVFGEADLDVLEAIVAASR